jgi:hypothetical protein
LTDELLPSPFTASELWDSYGIDADIIVSPFVPSLHSCPGSQPFSRDFPRADIELNMLGYKRDAHLHTCDVFLSFSPPSSPPVSLGSCVVRPVSFQIIFSFLCNCHQQLLPQKEAASGQCRRGNTRWWGECMIYFLQLLAHNFGTVKCYARNNGWSLHFLLGRFHIFCLHLGCALTTHTKISEM